MADKNKSRTEEEIRRVKIFARNLDYEMFCVYWKWLCSQINPKSVNRLEERKNDE